MASAVASGSPRSPPGSCSVAQYQGPCEFYSIVTNARRVAKPRSAAEAFIAISSLVAILQTLPVPVSTLETLPGLIRRHPVTGGDIFDLQIVATMIANGVFRIYTFNVEDFKVFSELEVLRP